MFLTGFSGLLYQVLWIRLFSSLLGGTTLSISCVIAHFMLGLGLGTAAAPRFLQRDSKKQLPLYSICEIAIVLVIGLGAIFLFGAHQQLAQILKDSPLPKLLSHFIMSGVFIFPATFLMGLSYPFMSYKFSSSKEHQWLYAANCLGGALGALCSYVVLIYNFGLSGALICGFILNLLAAALFYKEKYVFTSKAEASGEDRQSSTSVEALSPGKIKVWAMCLSGLSGFFVLSLEQIWFRLGHLFLGGRVYVHSVVLSVLLLTLAIGAFLSPRLSKLATDKQLAAVLFILRMTGFCAAIGFILLPSAVAIGVDLSHPYAKSMRLIYWGVLLFIAILPGLLLGLCFPLSLKVIQTGMSTQLQKTRSLSYSVYINTFASVLGSMLTTYLLFSWLGTVGSLKLLYVSLLVLGVVGSALFLRGASRISSVVVSCLLILFIGTRSMSLNPAGSALFEAEDEFGYLNVIPLKSNEQQGVAADRWAMFHNYTSLVAPYGFGETSTVQKSLALFPTAFAKNLDEVLVVGMGYGLTTEAFSRIPQIKQITSVDILPLVMKAQSELRFKDNSYLNDPRVKNVADDGRSFIGLSNKKWDIITVNVDPYGPGTTYLMSKEFYKMVQEHLKPGGIYAQLMFGAPRDLTALVHTAVSSFPYYRVMPGYSSDGVIFVGSKNPLPEWSEISLEVVKPLLPTVTWRGAMLASSDDFSRAEGLAKAWVDYVRAESPRPPMFVTDDNLLVETSRTNATDLFLTYPKDY
ncbi:fused MFS/spermidine synthase [Bdellovibrio sp. SKB1291214]|uniref:fused MFS/spermidine synthase n=1 Tax=Bdellovibrio sp. SKB1291214 TaxID=1732569 RepID=UPI002240D3A8|nr:fused MFS/spermidine synthase [Bdellovibrio sp. SKB1291214]UYL08361.1 fused MFS/spermidine synthase [Bdellovibrio sp. SKB1291214]